MPRRGLPGVEYFVEASPVAAAEDLSVRVVGHAAEPARNDQRLHRLRRDDARPSNGGRWRFRGIDEVMDLPRVLDGSARLHGVIQATLDDRPRRRRPRQPAARRCSTGGLRPASPSSHSPRVAEALTMLRKGVHLQLKTERTAEIFSQFLGAAAAATGATSDSPWTIGRSPICWTAAASNYEVRRAIELGVPAITAYQMATINNAVHWQVSRPPRHARPGALRRRAAGVGSREGRHRPRVRQRPPGRRARQARLHR